eukprot:1161896-Pelagomonas_calceolata.AAC.8
MQSLLFLHPSLRIAKGTAPCGRCCLQMRRNGCAEVLGAGVPNTWAPDTGVTQGGALVHDQALKVQRVLSDTVPISGAGAQARVHTAAGAQYCTYKNRCVVYRAQSTRPGALFPLTWQVAGLEGDAIMHSTAAVHIRSRRRLAGLRHGHQDTSKGQGHCAGQRVTGQRVACISSVDKGAGM